MFSLKSIFVTTLLALQASTAPTPALSAVDKLQKRESVDSAFTVCRGEFKEVVLSNLAASLDIQTFWRPSEDATSIILVHETDANPDSGVFCPEKSRYMEISFGNLDEEITMSSRFNGTCGEKKKTGFTLAEASFETSSTTKERLIRMSLTQGYGSWVVGFSTTVGGYGTVGEYKSVSFTPDDAVTNGGVRPNYIWYKNTESPHLSAELQCGFDWCYICTIRLPEQSVVYV
ncbi:hypothetical protein TWF718_008317 [Orbilia javanica]|uniref:Uncharacterized protein n=1 Tax=Orbilia javanica TaxID=47235 RepID=A0AAN8MWM4_9PEZI